MQLLVLGVGLLLVAGTVVAEPVSTLGRDGSQVQRGRVTANAPWRTARLGSQSPSYPRSPAHVPGSPGTSGMRNKWGPLSSNPSPTIPTLPPRSPSDSPLIPPLRPRSPTDSPLIPPLPQKSSTASPFFPTLPPRPRPTFAPFVRPLSPQAQENSPVVKDSKSPTTRACDCNCYNKGKPVCAMDPDTNTEETFLNKCHVDCINCTMNKRYKIVRQGEC